ncbi:MAG: Coenzyme F420 hydrogenase/dehydrogenase, beta subunit C-terminal domain [Sphingomonas sp.]|uniref:Coenzyme F420 hydrogenase/dehydrogenase, beta subunit C-terminal domain n=1 Tax=Sphingomonas sp. TaxID=28214 RepID=UPI001B28766D|nr:Coenzyme F420 hydrogenase/dehydrogenase, beta subunit C-terminal domain [Sphingomonas sp.]MBO9624282.1 Coenzyme F420 hydrogenase/dehydrogenase, beta subunit C-terminal domain [Sphingomonas sp.]
MRSPDRAAAPVSRRQIVDSGLCIGCGACAHAAPDGRMDWDAHGLLKPRGPDRWLRAPDAALARTCPFSPASADEDAIALARFPDAPAADSRIGRFEAAYVGHAEDAFRMGGSSGGLVSWAAAELLRQGLVDGVAHVAPADPEREGRFFAYRIARTVDEVRAGAKSRYYPVELSRVLAEIRATPGRYAVVGIPCFIKAINLLRAEDPLLAERIAFTLGLFCGHMKSARMVESFAWQLGADPAAVRALDYRIKDPGRPANWYRAHLELRDGSTRAQDWWHLADGDWGAGFFQSPACSWCDDVVAETADIAFGDAWVEPYSSDGRGTNVVIARSPALAALVAEGMGQGRLQLEPVDADFVAQTQAAGLRHRREGLAWRLAQPRAGLQPRKRVRPGKAGLPLRRRLIYRLRREIAEWSHRIFRLARLLGRPGIYIGWARLALATYQGVTYSRGRIGTVIDWLERHFLAKSRDLSA